MSGLMTSLSMAARALDAQRAGLAVAGENIANLNTDGYVRRTIELAQGAPGYGGVEVLGTRARRDAMLEARVRQEAPAEAREGAIANSLAVVEASLGQPGASLDAQLTAFLDGFADLAQDPTSTVARDNVVLQGGLLARSFNDLSSRLSDAERAADKEVRGGIDLINTLAAQVAHLNAAIGGANGADTEGLQDQLGLALKELAELAGVSVVNRPDGGADVSLGDGRAIVMGANAYALSATSVAPSGFASVALGGVDITGELAKGRMSGWLDVRDVNIPGYRSRLDTIAFAVVTEVNTLHQAGIDALAGTGNRFFAPLGAAAGAAAAIAVDAGVAGDSRKISASQTGAAGDNQVAKAIADLRGARVVNGTATFTESWGQLVYQVGSDMQTAQVQQASRREIVDQVAKLRDQVSGVSLDEEAAAMMRFQRAYEANARYFSAVDQMLATLMRIAGAA